MTTQPTQPHTRLVIAIIAAALIIGAAIYASTYVGTTASTHSIGIATSSTSTSNASLGLGLELQLFDAGSNGNLSIKLSAVNLLNTTNNIPFADHWTYSQDELSLHDGRGFGASLAFGIFSGNLSLGDIQAATPLPLYNASVQFACTGTLVPTTLVPLGNESVASSVGGYWTGGQNASPAAFMKFPAGVYTVIGVDEWGRWC